MQMSKHSDSACRLIKSSCAERRSLANVATRTARSHRPTMVPTQSAIIGTPSAQDFARRSTNGETRILLAFLLADHGHSMELRRNQIAGSFSKSKTRRKIDGLQFQPIRKSHKSLRTILSYVISLFWDLIRDGRIVGQGGLFHQTGLFDLSLLLGLAS